MLHFYWHYYPKVFTPFFLFVDRQYQGRIKSSFFILLQQNLSMRVWGWCEGKKTYPHTYPHTLYRCLSTCYGKKWGCEGKKRKKIFYYIVTWMENSAITDHGIFYHCRKLHQTVCHDEYLMRDYGWHDDKVRSRGKRPVTGQVSRTWYLWQGDVAPLTGPYPYGILKRDDEDPAVADFASARHLLDCRHGLLYILPFYWFILLTLPLCQLRVQNYYIMTTNHTKVFRFD